MKNPFLKKVPSAAIPADDDSKRKFDKFMIGQKFEVIPWSERNYGFLKKMISLLDIVVSNNPNWQDWHFLLKVIQLDVGSVEVGLDIHGKVTKFPKSISFKNMTEVEFTELFSNVIQYLLDNLNILIPGMPIEVYQSYVNTILEFDG